MFVCKEFAFDVFWWNHHYWFFNFTNFRLWTPYFFAASPCNVSWFGDPYSSSNPPMSPMLGTGENRIPWKSPILEWQLIFQIPILAGSNCEFAGGYGFVWIVPIQAATPNWPPQRAKLLRLSVWVVDFAWKNDENPVKPHQIPTTHSMKSHKLEVTPPFSETAR